MTVPCVVTVGVRCSPTGQSESLVFVADRPGRSVTLAVRGKGIASFTVRSAEKLLQALTTERPTAVVELPTIGRQHRTAILRATVHGPRALLDLSAGPIALHRWQVLDRNTLATAMTRSIEHLLAEQHT